jgi:hypothetical protein
MHHEITHRMKLIIFGTQKDFWLHVQCVKEAKSWTASKCNFIIPGDFVLLVESCFAIYGVYFHLLIWNTCLCVLMYVMCTMHGIGPSYIFLIHMKGLLAALACLEDSLYCEDCDLCQNMLGKCSLQLSSLQWEKFVIFLFVITYIFARIRLFPTEENHGSSVTTMSSNG